MKRTAGNSLLIQVGALSALLTGCSALKDTHDLKIKTDELHKTTQQLAKTTEDLYGETKQVRGSTNQVSGISKDMFYGARHSEASDTRRKTATQLRETSMDFGQKLVAAKTFLSAFEFQATNGSGHDREIMEGLYASAVQELVVMISPWARNPQRPTNPLPYFALDASASQLEFKDASNLLSLGAIAMNLDVIDDIQARTARKVPGIKAVSMLQIIQEALEEQAAVDSGKIAEADVKPAGHLVRKDRALMIYLLQLRASFLLAQPYLSIRSDFDPKAPAPWLANTKDLTVDALRENARYLGGSALTTQFLSKHGGVMLVKPDGTRVPFNTELVGLYKLMQVSKAEVSPPLGGSFTPEDKARVETRAGAMKKFLGAAQMVTGAPVPLVDVAPKAPDATQPAKK